ncbi:MAG: hypothetical protein LBS50_06030 [Prevotellaceae bacterium]|jgi:hypothetical protein|nr:hypothetical protein [Prevotellaceae bacterium]
MFEAFIITFILLFAGFAMLGIKVFFTKNGKFPNTHISANKELKKRGITCLNN